MNFPKELLYTKEHEWLKISEKTALIGITEFAQSELGDIVFVEINTVGQTILKNEVFGTVEAVKTVSDLFMPVSGKIIEANTALNNTPDMVNKDPYGEGWIIKIELNNPDETKSLLSASDYSKLVGK